MTNQASELDKAIMIGFLYGIQSDLLPEDEVVHRMVAFSHTKGYKEALAIIRTEKLKLLAEVRERTAIFKVKAHDKKGQPHLYEAGRGVPTEAVDKLEAEL